MHFPLWFSRNPLKCELARTVVLQPVVGCCDIYTEPLMILNTKLFTCFSLYLKSPSNPQNPSADYVNLCTTSQTYLLRQVHSSNSIFLVKTAGEGTNNSNNYDDNISTNNAIDRRNSVTAIAQCKSTLELQSPKADHSALSFMLEKLPVYDAPEIDGGMDIDLEHHGNQKNSLDESGREKAVDKFFADVPLSQAECVKAWVEVCGFAHKEGDNFKCWQPSVMAKLDIWKKIIEGSLLQEINLESQFLVKDLWAAIKDDEAPQDDVPFPKALFNAVILRLSDGFSEEHLNTGPRCKWYLYGSTTGTGSKRY